MFVQQSLGFGHGGPSKSRSSRSGSGSFVNQTYPNRLNRGRRRQNGRSSTSKISGMKLLEFNKSSSRKNESTSSSQRIPTSIISPSLLSSSSWRSRNDRNAPLQEVSSIRGKNDRRIPITQETMEAIESEIRHSIHLPCSIFLLAQSLKESDIVMTMHEHSNPPSSVPSATNWTDLAVISDAPEDDSNQITACNGTISSTSANKFVATATNNTSDNDMSILMGKFGNLDLVNHNNHANGRNENTKGKNHEDERVLKLKDALGFLSNSLGATRQKVNSWEEAKEVLNKVLLFPSHGSDEPFKKTSPLVESPGNAASSEQETTPSLSSVSNRKRPLTISNRQQSSFAIRKSPLKTPTAAPKSFMKKSKINPTPSLQRYAEMIAELSKKKEGMSKSSTSAWAQVRFFQVGKSTLQQSAENREDVEEEPTAEALEIKKALEEKQRQEEEIEREIEAQMEAKAAAQAAAAEEEEEEAPPLPPLTPEESALVKDILYGRPAGARDDDIISTVGTDSIQRGSIRKLQPGCWLNDEVIHFYLTLLARRDEQLTLKDTSRKRSHFFKSFFITKLLDDDCAYNYKNVKRWSKKVPGKDIFGLDKIICPVNLGNTHWCCAVVFMSEKRIQFYDSMGGSGRHYINGLFRYLEDEHMDKKKSPLPSKEEWELVECRPDTPQQLNGFDCGVFTCAFADFLSRDAPLNFTQSHVTELRERIALAIVKNDAMM